MTTQDVMTTEQVAIRFYELAEGGQWGKILDELFSDDAKSIEPADAVGFPEMVTGLDKIREKGRIWEGMIEQFHGGYCKEPQVAGNFFVCVMGTDVTMKGEARTSMDEVALYKVHDGKIVSEQFFY